MSLGDWICRKEGRSSVSLPAFLARVESLYSLQILNSEMVLMLLVCVHVEQKSQENSENLELYASSLLEFRVLARLT